MIARGEGTGRDRSPPADRRARTRPFITAVEPQPPRPRASAPTPMPARSTAPSSARRQRRDDRPAIAMRAAARSSARSARRSSAHRATGYRTWPDVTNPATGLRNGHRHRARV